MRMGSVKAEKPRLPKVESKLNNSTLSSDNNCLCRSY